ncbi:hypothetical protein DEQ92_20970 [Haloferax sp. Atlit-6N]|uniref:hypothetical protein n=1 Tax=Haloferacaceae TaxID=1644056 RepID=UPI000E27D837|nr:MULTISPECIES: hypothetical protein [Haloferacaceae]RDZ99085.1 hypothetical protein DEQ92_20970 [Haloferax sp. Atlit-6N]RLM89607.1 hypothetical protein D3D02_06925 [Halobellus sp. Atlit-38R]
MLLRAAALALGIAELLAPRRITDFWVGLATRGEAEVKSWVYTVARIEGALLVLWALKGLTSRSTDTDTPSES